MMNGDTDSALLWLDALIEAGHAWPDIAIEPLFDPIRQSDAFQSRLAGLEEKAAGHRAAIATQLASPDSGWIIP